MLWNRHIYVCVRARARMCVHVCMYMRAHILLSSYMIEINYLFFFFLEHKYCILFYRTLSVFIHLLNHCWVLFFHYCFEYFFDFYDKNILCSLIVCDEWRNPVNIFPLVFFTLLFHLWKLLYSNTWFSIFFLFFQFFFKLSSDIIWITN